MYQLIPIILTLALVNSQNSTGNITESVLLEIFGLPSESAEVSSTTSVTPSTRTTPVVTKTPFLGDKDASSTSATTLMTKNEDLSCTTDKGEKGECVRYYLCNAENNTIITDGSTTFDIRLSGPCPSYMDTCCLLPNKRPPTDPITPPPPTKDKIREGCGWRNPNGVAFRITGDTPNEYTRFAEFPWMVAILKLEPINQAEPEGQKLAVYVGGGSLINPNVVLTTAHYVAENKTWWVRAGEWDTQTTAEFYPYQERIVRRVEIHEDFNKKNLFFDVALLFFSKPMALAPNVGVACLPPARERAPSKTRCFATGWGKDRFGKEGYYQTILKKLEVPVVDRQTCQTQLRKTRLGRFFELHTSFMCAGGEVNKDTCSGDGGSPLVCPIKSHKDRYVQYGMVAWGIGCSGDIPAVYVDVGHLRSWIDEKVQEMGYETDSYTFKA